MTLLEAFAELGRLAHQFTDRPILFAEAVTDADTLALIQKGLQQGRGRKITKLVDVVKDDDGTFKGEFQQYVNPRLTKRFSFVYGENEVSLKPLNSDQIEKFSEGVEDFAGASSSGRAGKSLNCKIEQCGGRCLKSEETCRLTPTPEQKKIWSQASGKNLATKPETSLAKKRREMKAAREAEKAKKVAEDKKVLNQRIDKFIEKNAPPKGIVIPGGDGEQMVGMLSQRMLAIQDQGKAKYDASTYPRAIVATQAAMGNYAKADKEVFDYVVDKNPNGKPKDPVAIAALNRAYPVLLENLNVKQAKDLLDTYKLDAKVSDSKDEKIVRQFQSSALRTLKEAGQKGDSASKRAYENAIRKYNDS